MLHLYHNGAEVGAAPYQGISRQSYPKVPKALGIGCRASEADVLATPPGYWDGRLDEIAIFNHALTAGQVWQLYTGSASAVRPSLVKSAAEMNQAADRIPNGGEGRNWQTAIGDDSGRSQSTDLRKPGGGRNGLSCVSVGSAGVRRPRTDLTFAMGERCFMKMRFCLAAFVVFGLGGLAQADTLPAVTGTLVYHLDASVSESVHTTDGLVTQWDDQANGYNFVGTGTGTEPTVSTLNGLPAIHFDGSDVNSLESNASVSTGGTIFIVETTTVYNSLAGIWGPTTYDGGIRRSSTNSTDWRGPIDNYTTYIDGTLGTGQPVGTPGVLAANCPFTNVWVESLGGYNSSYARDWTGDIAEVIAFSTTLSDADRNAVTGYLGTKYGISTPYNTPEPGTLALLVTGLVGLLCYAWRRRK